MALLVGEDTTRLQGRKYSQKVVFTLKPEKFRGFLVHKALKFTLFSSVYVYLRQRF